MSLSLVHLPIYGCVDIETSSLDVKTNHLLEISMQLTNRWMQVYNAYHAVAHVDEKVMALSSWCDEKHNANGLVDEVKKSTTTLTQIEDALLANIAAVYKQFKKSDQFFYVDQKTGKEELNVKSVSETLRLFGSSVHFDRQMIQKCFPRLFPLFNHQLQDVTVLFMSSVLYGPKDLMTYKPDKLNHSHRSEQDLEDSMTLMRYYINRLFGHTYLQY